MITTRKEARKAKILSNAKSIMIGVMIAVIAVMSIFHVKKMKDKDAKIVNFISLVEKYKGKVTALEQSIKILKNIEIPELVNYDILLEDIRTLRLQRKAIDSRFHDYRENTSLRLDNLHSDLIDNEELISNQEMHISNLQGLLDSVKLSTVTFRPYKLIEYKTLSKDGLTVNVKRTPDGGYKIGHWSIIGDSLNMSIDSSDTNKVIISFDNSHILGVVELDNHTE